MKTILIPTDFSETSKNAIAYAIQLAKSFAYNKIILYHSFQIPITGDPIMPMAQMIDFESIKQLNEENLRHFEQEIKASIDTNDISIESISELNNVAFGVTEAAARHSASLIIAGITEASKIEETFVGSNAIDIAKESTIPVIIVPQEATFDNIRKILFACDLKNIVETTPIDAIKKMVTTNNSKLLMLHISHKGENFSSENATEMKRLDGLLEGLYPEYHFVENDDFMEAINDFAVSKDIDLIIAIPKKHGFFEEIFKKSHVKMLAYHSHIPLMVVHD